MKCESSTKMRILVILRMLQTQTDETRGISMQEIICELKALGIRGERKAIYNDFSVLQSFGLDIQKRHTRPPEYFLANRQFSSKELALIIDAVQSCKFITPTQAREISNRLASLACVQDRDSLQRNIHVDMLFSEHAWHAHSQSDVSAETLAGAQESTPKNTKAQTIAKNDKENSAQNTHVLDNVAIIHDALREKKRITFTYWKMGLDGQAHAQHDGRIYNATPMRVSFSEGFYYLTAFTENSTGEKSTEAITGTKFIGGAASANYTKTTSAKGEQKTPKLGEVREYRVDRMRNVEVSTKAARRYHALLNYEFKPRNSEYFGRFDGELVYAGLSCDTDGVNIVTDRFGADAKWTPCASAATQTPCTSNVKQTSCTHDAKQTPCASSAKKQPCANDEPHKDLRAIAHVHVRVSPQFFGWVAGMNGKVKIASPKKLANEYRKYLEALLRG